jgi:excinuclease ABC subunit B
MVADPVVQYMTKPQLQKTLDKTKKSMMKASKQQDYLEAAKLRDEMFVLEKMMKEKFE